MRRYGFEADRVSLRLAVAAVLVAWGVTWAGLMQTPSYEASGTLLVGQKQKGPWANFGGSGEEIQTLEYRELPTQTLIHAIDSRPVAQEVIRRLKLDTPPDELLDNLSAEQLGGTQFIRVSYTDTDPVRAARTANAVSRVFAEFASHRRSDVTAEVWERATVPDSPISPRPYRNGALTLVVGLALAGVLPHGVPRSLTAGTAQIADGLVEAFRFKSHQVLTVARRRLAARRARDHDGSMPIEVIKEKMVLVALDRCGRLSAVQAAMETGLTVDSVDRILSDLANSGHLQITVEDGKLLYSFWGQGA
jgi:capsular polysaccharide biosynthesis protein